MSLREDVSLLKSQLARTEERIEHDRSSFREMLEVLARRFQEEIRERERHTEYLLKNIEYERKADEQDWSSKYDRAMESIDELKNESFAILSVTSMGLATSEARFNRLVPIRAYLDVASASDIYEIGQAVQENLDSLGFDLAGGPPAIYGSWMKRWFAKSRDVMSQPEVLERLQKLERAAELKLLDKPQADIDDKQAAAMSKLIKSLEKVPNAALQAGSILIVKITNSKGQPVIQARTLSQREMQELENNQMLLNDPAEVLAKLADACREKPRRMVIRGEVSRYAPPEPPPVAVQTHDVGLFAGGALGYSGKQDPKKGS